MISKTITKSTDYRFEASDLYAMIRNHFNIPEGADLEVNLELNRRIETDDIMEISNVADTVHVRVQENVFEPSTKAECPKTDIVDNATIDVIRSLLREQLNNRELEAISDWISSLKGKV